MVERVKASYALTPEAIEDLERLGEAHRWSRAKTIEALIEFYARVQMAVETAQVQLNGLHFNAEIADEEYLDPEEAQDARLNVLFGIEPILKNLCEQVKSGLAPNAGYRGLNIGEELLREAAEREREMEEFKKERKKR